DRFVSISRSGRRLATVGATPGEDETITATATTRHFEVKVVADNSVASEGVTEALALTGSLALLAVGVAVALAVLQAPRLARPIQDLAEAADRLGSGGAGPPGPRDGIAGLDRGAQGLG